MIDGNFLAIQIEPAAQLQLSGQIMAVSEQEQLAAEHVVPAQALIVAPPRRGNCTHADQSGADTLVQHAKRPKLKGQVA